MKEEKCRKNSLKERVFVNLALQVQYHIVKNTLLQTAFLVMKSTGKEKKCRKLNKKHLGDD